MDPNQTLLELLECIAARDIAGAQEHCENLCEWIGKGGFVPRFALIALDAVKKEKTP